MLELPESRTLARQMAETLAGKTVTQVTVQHSPHKWAWFSGDPAAYPAILEGGRVTGADAYGGMSELQLDGLKLTVGDGTNVRYYAPGAKLPEKHQLRLDFGDGSAMLCSVQMYGGIWLMEGDAYEGYQRTAKESVDPLSEAFNASHFEALWASVKPTLSAKAFLATEQRVPGLGNGVLQDILFGAGIHPRRKLQGITDAQREKLFQSVKSTLAEMTRQGGRDTERDLFGEKGGYRTLLSSGTLQYPCPRCGGPLAREAYLGGNVYYCAACQPL